MTDFMTDEVWASGEIVTAQKLNKMYNDVFKPDGSLIIQPSESTWSTFDISKTNNGLTTDTVYCGFRLKDSVNNNLGGIMIRGNNSDYSSSAVQMVMRVRGKPDENNNTFYNEIGMTVEKDGTCSYKVQDPAAFRDAIKAPRRISATSTWNTLFGFLDELKSLETATIFIGSSLMQTLSSNKITTNVAGVVTRLNNATGTGVNFDFTVRGTNELDYYCFRLTTDTSGSTPTFSNGGKITATAL